MKVSIKMTAIENQKTPCIVLGVFEKGELTPSGKKIDQLSRHALKEIIKKSNFSGQLGQILPVFHLQNTKCEQLLLVGLGKQNNLTPFAFRRAIVAAGKALMQYRPRQVISYLAEVPISDRSLDWKIKQITEATLDACYRFEVFKSQNEQNGKIEEFGINVPRVTKASKRAVEQGQAIASGMKVAKDLANLPSNICTPTYFAEHARMVAKTLPGVSIKILNEKEMQKLKMGALLAVSQGSAEPAQLICLEYKGQKKKASAPVVLIGKGVTFDTGGNSLKPADSMVGMKYDMCGAAAVLGAMQAVALLKLPINVVGIMPLVENMPGGTAYKAEDIITSMSGQTIEVISTDAEGRLILADALTYAERYKPDVVIDIATLTGAVVIALGFLTTAVLSPDETLAKELVHAGMISNDRTWQLPLFAEYQEQIKSPFADMSNVGGRPAGVITAACFLERFAKKFRWAHLDVAGTAAMMIGSNDRAATGRPIPMLLQFLIDRAEAHAN